MSALDTEVFYHWLKYYSDKVDDFFINLWGDSNIINFDEIISIMKEFGIETFGDYRDRNTFNEEYKTSIFNGTISTKPNDWWIPIDCDEFIHFDGDVKEEVQYNEENAYDYVFQKTLGPEFPRVAKNIIIVIFFIILNTSPSKWSKLIWYRYPPIIWFC